MAIFGGSLFMRPGNLFKAKLLVALLAGVVVVGGATAVFAATPAGQGALHALTGAASANAAPEATKQSHNAQSNACAGLADAQHLASRFSLSAASDSDAVQAICALHAGTFKGVMPDGSAVSSSRVFGYGEIDLLLTYAQYLASHDQTNTSSKLTTENARGYLAEAVQNCRATPLEPCLKAHIPGYQPGNDNGNGNQSGSGGGKPESTPTPHHSFARAI
jgi:hypothetical protein